MPFIWLIIIFIILVKKIEVTHLVDFVNLSIYFIF